MSVTKFAVSVQNVIVWNT